MDVPFQCENCGEMGRGPGDYVCKYLVHTLCRSCDGYANPNRLVQCENSHQPCPCNDDDPDEDIQCYCDYCSIYECKKCVSEFKANGVAFDPEAVRSISTIDDRKLPRTIVIAGHHTMNAYTNPWTQTIESIVDMSCRVGDQIIIYGEEPQIGSIIWSLTHQQDETPMFKVVDSSRCDWEEAFQGYNIYNIIVCSDGDHEWKDMNHAAEKFGAFFDQVTVPFPHTTNDNNNNNNEGGLVDQMEDLTVSNVDPT